MTKEYHKQQKKEESVNKWYVKTDCLFGGKIILESHYATKFCLDKNVKIQNIKAREKNRNRYLTKTLNFRGTSLLRRLKKKGTNRFNHTKKKSINKCKYIYICIYINENHELGNIFTKI